MKAGSLRERFVFSRRNEVSDGAGNFEAEWIDNSPVSASRMWLRGGETVIANRLAGRSPAIITIRSSIASRQITAGWRCRDTRTGEIFNIRQVMPATKRDEIELLLDLGVVT